MYAMDITTSEKKLDTQRAHNNHTPFSNNKTDARIHKTYFIKHRKKALDIDERWIEHSKPCGS